MINQKVITPIGQGIEQGKYATFDGEGMVVKVQRLVRLVINDETIKHLQDANCLTPRAQHSGLWIFAFEEGER